MTLAKRAFDLFFAVFWLIVLSPLLAWLVYKLWRVQGRPIFYVAERMKTPDTAFGLWKFRTMTPATDDQGVSGANKASRITPLGAKLRARRLDEFPQLWNILRGDISFVGPRPPLREYVEMFPDMYQNVLKSRPGVTGLASIMFHKHEEMLLSQCETAKETETVYTTVCAPRKARIDLIYQKNRSFCFDMVIIVNTILNLFRRKPVSGKAFR